MHSTQIESKIVQQFVLSVTIPILYEIESSAALVASGTLFKIAERSFVITARHIFDEVSDFKLLAFPENPYKGSLHTFGDIKVYKPKEEHIDVAVIELHDPATVARLNAGWQFLTSENVAPPSTNPDDGGVFVSGYPVSLTSESNGWTHGQFVTAFTQRLPVVPPQAKKPVIEDLDLFFDYGHQAQSLEGETVLTPELPGVSGASIWEITHPTSTIWSPDQNVRVVGIQSAFRHSNYIRAKNWWAVAMVLEQVDELLASEVRTKLQQL
jgi:hypothetical protein